MRENNDFVQRTLKQLNEITEACIELRISSMVSKLNQTSGGGKFCYHITDGEISFYKTDDNYSKLKLIAKISYYDASDLQEILSLFNIQPVERSDRGSTDCVVHDDSCNSSIVPICTTTHRVL